MTVPDAPEVITHTPLLAVKSKLEKFPSVANALFVIAVTLADAVPAGILADREKNMDDVK